MLEEDVVAVVALDERLLYFWMMDSRSLELMVNRFISSVPEVLEVVSAWYADSIIFTRVGLFFMSLVFSADIKRLYMELLELSDPWLPVMRSIRELSELVDPWVMELRRVFTSSRDLLDRLTVSVMLESEVLVVVLESLVEEDCWMPKRRLESRELMLLTFDISYPPVSHIIGNTRGKINNNLYVLSG
jgi:hypothetical protein